jgi:hypothetical protein
MSQDHKPGDIVAIPLPEGGYAFGKLFKGDNIGIYGFISESILPLDEVTKHGILFFSGVDNKAITSGGWPVIGNQPFQHEAESWPPPTFAQDLVDRSRFRVTDQGNIKEAKPYEIAGLENTIVRTPELLVREICFQLVK